MADRYWVGGSALGNWTTSNTAPWRSTPGASFSGSQSGNTVTFSNLQGTIAVGHYVYVNGYASTTIASNLVFNPDGTSGSFRTAASRTISTKGMCTHSSNTGVSVPGTADSVYLTAGSCYLDGNVTYAIGSVYTITNLNMDGFKGGAIDFGLVSPSYSLFFTGTITFPYNTGANIYSAFFDLRSGATINNNGNTTLNSGDMLNNVNYQVNGITPPANIIAYEVSLKGAVNLSNRTITAVVTYALTGATVTPGTSKLITQNYYSYSVNASTLYDVEGLNIDGTVFLYSDADGLICNSITMPTSGTTYTDLVINNTSTKYLNYQSPDLYNGTFRIISISGTTKTLTKIGGGSVMLQINSAQDITFLPANTFFTVGADYTTGGFNGTNLRPSPNPLNFV